MAKKKKAKLKPKDPAAALEAMEQPSVKWKAIAQIAVGVLVIWVIAGMLTPYISYWGFVVAGVITLGLVGIAVYMWRMMKKSTGIVDILKTAKDGESRAAALEALRAKDPKAKDALNKLAQAQLAGQDDPQEALRILESIDIEKAPIVVQDDVRANRALMYLVHGRPKDARPLADDIKIERGQGKQRGMYAAIIAEAFARTGKEAEARKLLETYSYDDPAYADVRSLLLRAEVYTNHKLKKRGRVRNAMSALAQIDPNMVGAFLMKGHPDLKRAAREALSAAGVIPKQQVKMRVR